MRRRILPVFMLCLMLLAATTRLGLAQGASAPGYDRNLAWHTTKVTATVESRRDGVYVRITVRDSSPGEKRDAPVDDGATEADTNPVQNASTQTTSTGVQDRYWRDVQGIHRQTADGHEYLLTPPPIGAGSLDAWTSDLRQHPNETPYLLYVDGQYSDVVWIPQSTPSSALQVDVQRSSSARPSGNGDSTDPREVALDALGHVPLPAIHLQVNPALGLVHLPGWFWVEGYDGRPFGLERRVTVPPEVGDDVPITVVPADDSRRRETHFTVQVRLWASRYEWDFGDGQNLLTTSLGKAMPAESDLQHTYEYSSLGLPDGFPVRLIVTFDAEYHVNGGPPIGLPPIQQTYEYGYRVQEIQSILTQR